MVATAATAVASAPDPARAARLMRQATYASVGVAAILIVIKVAAWWVTDSVAVLSSLLDSLLDAAASLVNLLAVRHALTPADREHRFGHGKAEPLAGLAQAAFITGSALLLLSEAVHRFFAPLPIAHGEIGIGVMVVSILFTIVLVTYQRRVASETGSVAIGADRLHYTGDVLLNGSVIVSLVLSSWWNLNVLDPIFGVAIGAFILVSALKIGRSSFDLLMDRELPDADRARIKAIVLNHPEVRNIHELRTRSAGTSIFIQFHLELDGAMSLRRAHEISDAVEAEVMAAFPQAEVIIHQDPAGVEQIPRDDAVPGASRPV
jgi:ferrous-iron efflux pump FieF